MERDEGFGQEHVRTEDPCRDVLAELEVYLDGECGPSVERTVRAHLADCPRCLDRADFRRQLRALVASKCRDEAPNDLVTRIIDNLPSV